MAQSAEMIAQHADSLLKKAHNTILDIADLLFILLRSGSLHRDSILFLFSFYLSD